jgi:diketogulonate reductase-like aldo/keto reductase
MEETIEGMEKREGKILKWRVSNFDIDDMKELWNMSNRKNCVTNQVLHHIGSRA